MSLKIRRHGERSETSRKNLNIQNNNFLIILLVYEHQCECVRECGHEGVLYMSECVSVSEFVL
jgi:hypothetical protein